MKPRSKKVILINMGGVEKPSDIPLFLFNMFNDKFILSLPLPIRFFVSIFITAIRFKDTLRIQRQTPSPLKRITRNQAELLHELAGMKTKVAFVYSTPKLKSGNSSIFVAMYNFYSHTTHGQILKKVRRVVPPFCLYNEFFDLVIKRIDKYLRKLDRSKTVLLLSAHSIPKRYAKLDPYASDIKVFHRYLSKKLKCGVFLSFQSRLGPVQWLQPTTEDEIKRLSKFYENIIIFPISFTTDNTETINEIDIFYKKLALKEGFKRFFRVECFNDDEDFVRLISSIVSSYKT